MPPTEMPPKLRARAGEEDAVEPGRHLLDDAVGQLEAQRMPELEGR